MMSADRISGSVFFLIGVGAIIGAIRLEIGSPGEPQPGFFPFLAGLALALLSVLLIVQDVRGRGSGGEAIERPLPPLLAVLGLIAFVILLGPFGYIPACALLAAVILLVLNVRAVWIFALLVPLVSIGSFLLFDWALNVPLPSGPLAAWLGL